eukprot:5363561-Prymnesium_polylepis.1
MDGCAGTWSFGRPPYSHLPGAWRQGQGAAKHFSRGPTALSSGKPPPKAPRRQIPSWGSTSIAQGACARPQKGHAA